MLVFNSCAHMPGGLEVWWPNKVDTEDKDIVIFENKNDNVRLNVQIARPKNIEHNSFIRTSGEIRSNTDADSQL